MSRTTAFILAGGAGDRLSILAEYRAKPAMPFAVHYRLIDFTLSNCARADVRPVAVLTQYQPRSLHRHLRDGAPWGFSGADGLMLLQPYLRRAGEGRWYGGTADAVRQNLVFLEDHPSETVLVLAGDHVYIMDYAPLIAFHRERDADITVGVTPVPAEEASRFGILACGSDGRVVDFEEKPECPPSTLASMGIYVFRTSTLVRLLLPEGPCGENASDFGRDIIPCALRSGSRVFGYEFHGYWRDVGTLESYWEASMDLLGDAPALPPDVLRRGVLTRMPALPPVHVGRDAHVVDSLLGIGADVRGSVERSLVFPRVVIGEGAVVRESVLMDGAVVGADAVVERTVIDKAVQIGAGARIGVGPVDRPNEESPGLIQSGLNVVGKGAHIPPGFTVQRNTVIGPRVRDALHGRDSLPAGATVRRAEKDRGLP